MKLDGIHHITAITGDAPGNVEFYTGVLGLRMVKQTVNEDDQGARRLELREQHVGFGLRLQCRTCGEWRPFAAAGP